MPERDDMSTTALLIIDMQKVYFTDPQLKRTQNSLVDSTNQLIAMAHRCEMPIFNIRTEHTHSPATWTITMRDDEQGYLFKGSEQVENIPGLELSDTIDLVKTRDSAFYATNLTPMLHNYGIDTVILCGVSTQSCIAQSASDAFAADFHAIIARDAVASNRPEFEDVSLAILRSEYRQEIITTRAIIKKMDQRKEK